MRVTRPRPRPAVRSQAAASATDPLVARFVNLDSDQKGSRKVLIEAVLTGRDTVIPTAAHTAHANPPFCASWRSAGMVVQTRENECSVTVARQLRVRAQDRWPAAWLNLICRDECVAKNTIRAQLSTAPKSVL